MIPSIIQQNLSFGNIFKVPATPENIAKAKKDANPLWEEKKFSLIHKGNLFYEPSGNEEELNEDFEKAGEITEYSCAPCKDCEDFRDQYRQAVLGKLSVYRSK